MNRDLVRAAANGDHAAFEALASTVVDRLFAVARLMLRRSDEAEDAVQECLVRAWRDLPGLRDPDRFDGWLHRLIVNACIDVMRQRRRFEAHIAALRPTAQTPDEAHAIAERDRMERAFVRLQPEQRAVVVLHFYLDLPAVEVAALMGIPLGTAKSRIHYATEAIRAALDAEDRAAASNVGRTA